MNIGRNGEPDHDRASAHRRVTYLDYRRFPVYTVRMRIRMGMPSPVSVSVQHMGRFGLWGKLPQNVLERRLAGHDNLHGVQ